MSTQAFATNGMNMEGYGPVSSAMGGTAQAYNNGLGGMMNNPATMGMGSKEGNKFQIAVGKLGPDVSVKQDMYGIDQDSSGTAYYMPGFGFARKRDGLTYGIGILGQGGMGTEFGRADTSMASEDLFKRGFSMMQDPTSSMPRELSGDKNRSELSVGRVIVPVNMEVNDKLTVGASIDFVWAGMDMMMDMSGSQFRDLAYSDPATFTRSGNVSGTMLSGLEGMFMGGMLSDVNWARFDFSNDDRYTGEAKATGFGGKLGMTYVVNNKLTLGASYHSKTNLSDMTGDATLSMNVVMPGMGTQTIPVEGEVKIKDFQWPSTFAFGAAYRPTDKWLLTADYKRINWSETMKDFNMVFEADATQSNPFAAGFANAELDVSLPQEWDDQNVIMLGGAYQYNKNLTLRAGLNVANNPVPDEHVNPLFPATVERHYTLGFGYNFDKSHTIDASFTHAPATEVTGDGDLNDGLEISHGQTNWQLMYTYKWGIVKK